MFKHRVAAVIVGVVSVGGMSSAKAALPVIDIGALAQLLQQIIVMRDQLSTVRNQLNQAQQQYQSMTGSRGMDVLLSGTVRNYLPPDWQAVQDALNGARATYATLTGQINAAINANAVLTPAQLQRLSVQARAQLDADRQAAAVLQAISRQALDTSSQRFNALQQLINAIPTAHDQKAVLDLQARIGVEQAMLQNEQTKLQMLSQTLEAEDRSREQRSREMAIANFGSLRSRPAIGLN